MAKNKKEQTAAPTKVSVLNFEPEALVIIGIDTEDDESHPLFDKRNSLPVSEALVRNIMHQGVIQPISVSADGDQYLVVAGRQRTRAAREANRRITEAGGTPLKIRAVKVSGDETSQVEVMMAENAIRQSDSPMENAQRAKKLFDLTNDAERVALAFGVQAQTVDLWLSVLSAHKKVRDAVDSGKLTFTAASTLASLSKSKQVEALEIALEGVEEGEKVSVARAQSAKKAAKKGDSVLIKKPGKKTLKMILAGLLDGHIEEISSIDLISFVMGDMAVGTASPQWEDFLMNGPPEVEEEEEEETEED